MKHLLHCRETSSPPDRGESHRQAPPPLPSLPKTRVKESTTQFHQTATLDQEVP
ncbi:hypothetical protein E2C01_098321 [Portunus trituberculatus]|uniref:Uncharacterized protein n=1 Tax=Portunus trituberculatus TaxID=210409 RepID=A0A5B7K2Q2_PORTR|nr:hypothetical protein [Portunus trituberculatus]